MRPITLADRRRIASTIDGLIAFLDAIDAPTMDREPDTDLEWSGDECEPSDATDPDGRWLTTVSGPWEAVA